MTVLKCHLAAGTSLLGSDAPPASGAVAFTVIDVWHVGLLLPGSGAAVPKYLHTEVHTYDDLLSLLLNISALAIYIQI